MEERSPSSSAAGEKSADNTTPKQAACLNCRRSKTRCLRSSEDIRCRRCTQTDSECIVPEYHVGRKKGIKKYGNSSAVYSDHAWKRSILTDLSKRTGLDKAVYRIEQALKKSKASDDGQAYHLQTLLDEAQGLVPRGNSASDLIPAISEPPRPQQLQPPRSSSNREYAPNAPPQSNSSDDHFVLDSAENPLQLLAHASDLSAAQPPLGFGGAGMAASPHSMLSRTDSVRETDLQAFFGPLRPKLDVGEDIDPIDMGYVSHEEAEYLFSYFYQNLSHTRWGMDQKLHTAKFVRSRSAFLFTSIMAAAALFIPSAGALSKRLSVHCKRLAHHVITNRNRSPEIVLAYMVNIPWMSPGRHWADDETCTYMAMALTIAIDISLDKIIVSNVKSSSMPKGVNHSDCINAKKALELDGFDDVDPASAMGQRLLRRRERVWLALFVLDRGVCLSRGRTFTVPMTNLIENCDHWHKSGIADIWDGSIIASAVMRRDLVSLIEDVKRGCETVPNIDGITVAESLQGMIEGFFNKWYATWAYSIPTEGSKQTHLPPYVEILVTHLRLSIYSIVVNHPIASIEVKRFFRAAGLASALNVMRVAVQGERQLKSIPNNSAIMISFAALFALRLSTLTTGGGLSLAPSIRTLIEETADVLERIGATPSHRKGSSALYGRHLREVINATPGAAPPQPPPPPASQRPLPPLAAHHAYMDPPPGVEYHHANSNSNNNNNNNNIYPPPEPMQLSAMSDYQIVEAIHGLGGELEEIMPQFSGVPGVDDRMGLDWLNWFNMENHGQHNV